MANGTGTQNGIWLKHLITLLADALLYCVRPLASASAVCGELLSLRNFSTTKYEKKKKQRLFATSLLLLNSLSHSRAKRRRCTTNERANEKKKKTTENRNFHSFNEAYKLFFMVTVFRIRKFAFFFCFRSRSLSHSLVSHGSYPLHAHFGNGLCRRRCRSHTFFRFAS